MTKSDIQNILLREYSHSYQHKVTWKQAINKFNQLNSKQSDLAIEGIERYLLANEKCNLRLDCAPIREIIEDALDYRQVWKETDSEFLRNTEKESEKRFKEKLNIKSFAVAG